MNLMFWKKKKKPEESDHSAADETLVATETNLMPAKPGFWTRLKSALSPSRKKSKPDQAEEPKPSAKQTGKKQRDEEPEPSDIPAEKPGKKLVIVLALLAPLVAAGGFFAVKKLLSPPQHQKAPPAKNSASLEAKVDGHPAPEPTKAAEHAPQPEPKHALPEPAPQPADNAATPAAEAPAPPAKTPVADAPAPANKDIQAQIEALKKQNQEMQAQIEALKKQPARSTASAMPREGVLIINGKNATESVQGLKSVIEEMNAASGGRSPRKPADKPKAAQGG